MCPCVRVCTDLFVPCTRTCKDTLSLRSRAPCVPGAFDVTLYSRIPGFVQTSPITQDLNQNSDYLNTHTPYIPRICCFLPLGARAPPLEIARAFFFLDPQSSGVCVSPPAPTAGGGDVGGVGDLHTRAFSVLEQNNHLGRVEPDRWRNPGDLPVRREIFIIIVVAVARNQQTLQSRCFQSVRTTRCCCCCCSLW